MKGNGKMVENRRPKTRDFLTEREVHRLLEVVGAAGERNALRNQLLIHMLYNHGLRLREALDMTLDQVDMVHYRVYVKRLKKGFSSWQPMGLEEVKLFNKWQKQRSKIVEKHKATMGAGTEIKLFLTSTGRVLTSYAIQLLFQKWGEQAGFMFHIHPHMLRHARGYAMADQGLDTRLIQDFLGHKNIMQTVKYTAANVARFDRVRML
jgi:type 1 fimbriae regulatory protein FimB